jgi:hypothetical protein
MTPSEAAVLLSGDPEVLAEMQPAVLATFAEVLAPGAES